MPRMLLGFLIVVAPVTARSQAPVPVQVEYVQNSEEYATLTRMVYRDAIREVTRSARTARRGGWAVVLDLDETTLDNSDYEREQRGGYTQASWDAWVGRHEAGRVPGVGAFVDSVRKLGGRIAWITDRNTLGQGSTRENLKQLELWNDGDRLCVRSGADNPKAARRRAVLSGRGDCSWGRPTPVLAFLGDQLKKFPDDSTADFPGSGEGATGAGTDASFGTRFFLIPNPMYGLWTQCVTRRDRAPRQVPTLVVAIAVDQMRNDYLDRFGSQLTGGLRRLLDQGARFTRAYQDHGMAETAAGHASMLSGRWPNSTGIIRNSDANDSTPLLEVPGEGASPLRFRGTELFDWMKACWPSARVLSVSRKERAAMMPVGRAKGDVFWYQGGIFTTSRYYMDTLPAWLKAFSREAAAARAPGTAWNLLLDPSQYPEPDSEPYENGGRDLVFPHVLPADTATALFRFVATPAMDSITLALALRGVHQLGLGRGPGADLLSISLSATDYIGHTWGPDSREIHDQILHLDRYLGAFLDSLPKLVPGARIVLELTADHGVTSYPEYANQHGNTSAQWINISGMVNQLNGELLAQTGVRNAIRDFGMGLIVIDRRGLEAKGMDVDALVARIAHELRGMPQVQRVDTPASLQRADTASDDVARRWIHLIPRDLDAELMVSLKPGSMWGTAGGADAHGQPSEDDTHVPLLFWGTGIRPGQYTDRVGVVDIAPTLATILGVVPDPAVQGQVLREALTGR